MYAEVVTRSLAYFGEGEGRLKKSKRKEAFQQKTAKRRRTSLNGALEASGFRKKKRRGDVKRCVNCARPMNDFCIPCSGRAKGSDAKRGGRTKGQGKG